MNGPAPTRTPTPEPGPPPPQQPPPSSPQPAPWPPAPAPPTAGATGSITYTDSALRRFAATSDDRAARFRQARAEAERIQVSHDAFGYMFGALVYGSYEQQARTVTEGMQAAAAAMSEIADAMRVTADRMDAANASIIASADHAHGHS